MQLLVAAAANEPDPSTVGPGTAAFVTFAFLVIACLFLFRSLSKQLKKVDFEEAPEPDPEATGERQEQR